MNLARRGLRRVVGSTRRRWAAARYRAAEAQLRKAPAVAPFLERSDVTTAPVRGRPVLVSLMESTTPWSLPNVVADRVREALEEAGVPVFATHRRYARVSQWAIPEAGWADAVAVLGRLAAQEPYYVTSSVKSADATLLAERGAVDALANASALVVFRFVRDTTRDRVFGVDMGCEIHRWSEKDGELVAPGRNGLVQRIPAGVPRVVRTPRWDDVLEPRLALLEKPDAFEIDFPVDAVYLWVDDSDPRWCAKRAEVRRALGLETQSPSDAAAESLAAHRYRDRGELRHSLRSLEYFAPWIRNVYLVTDDQVPEWLAEDQNRVTVVDHRDIFPTGVPLPTYNSHAIGSQVHRIPGLAQHYLLMNDDVLFNRAVSPSDFFTASGSLRVNFSKSRRPLLSPDRLSPVERARARTAQLLERDFGRFVGTLFAHTPVPQRVDLAEEIAERYADEIATTLSHQFRSGEDLVINSWLTLYYALFTGRAEIGNLRFGYFNVGSESARASMENIRRMRALQTICVNDVPGDDGTDEGEWLREWLAAQYPVPGSFERRR